MSIGCGRSALRRRPRRLAALTSGGNGAPHIPSAARIPLLRFTATIAAEMSPIPRGLRERVRIGNGPEVRSQPLGMKKYRVLACRAKIGPNSVAKMTSYSDINLVIGALWGLIIALRVAHLPKWTRLRSETADSSSSDRGKVSSSRKSLTSFSVFSLRATANWYRYGPYRAILIRVLTLSGQLSQVQIQVRHVEPGILDHC